MLSPYLNYSQKVVDPPVGVMGKYAFFDLLAKKMGLVQNPNISQKEFLEKSVAPLNEKYGVDVNTLRTTGFSLPHREIPWKDGRFDTPSEKYELYSETAKRDGQSPIPVFLAPHFGFYNFPCIEKK